MSILQREADADLYDERGYEMYKLKLAISRHFSGDGYDFFKYKGAIKVKKSTYMAKNDRYHYVKIAEKYPDEHQATGLFVACFLEHGDTWVGRIAGGEGEKAFRRWQGRIESMAYTFETEMKKLLDMLYDAGYNRQQLFEPVEELGSPDMPFIYKMLMRREVSFETFIILNMLLKFRRKCEKSLGRGQTMVFRGVKQKLDGYAPFLNVDIEKYKLIMKNVLKNYAM